jgi:hypothetical protein
MLNQELQKSLEEEQRIQRDHQTFRRPFHQSGLTFGLGCIAGDARAAAVDSLRRPIPSRPSTPCLSSRLTPAPNGCSDATRRFKEKRVKDIKIFKDTSRKRIEAHFQLLTHPF